MLLTQRKTKRERDWDDLLRVSSLLIKSQKQENNLVVKKFEKLLPVQGKRTQICTDIQRKLKTSETTVEHIQSAEQKARAAMRPGSNSL